MIAFVYLESLFASCLLTLDRLFAISMPLRHRTAMTRGNTDKRLIGITWFVSTVVSVVFSVIQMHDMKTQVLAYIMQISLLVTLIIIIASYSIIFVTVRRTNSSKRPELNHERSYSKHARQKKEKVLLLHSLVIILSSVICRCPYIIYCTFYSLEDHNKTPEFMAASTMLLIANTGIDPFLYLFIKQCVARIQRKSS